jgi:hypothetical protein
MHATSEALRALQTVGQAPGARGSAVGFLDAALIENSDDHAAASPVPSGTHMGWDRRVRNTPKTIVRIPVPGTNAPAGVG